MSTTQTTDDRSRVDELTDFLRAYYSDEVNQLAQHYPKEQQSLEISWRDLHQAHPSAAEDLLAQPGRGLEELEAALHQYDLPVDISIDDAHVRVGDLLDEHIHYPGGFSPTEEAGNYRAITGEVSRATDVYSILVEAAFECQRCGITTYIPQNDSGFQEPHECQGCERQGPFRVNNTESTFVDGQKFRIQTPPEVASGAGQEIDVFVEDDLADQVTVGDSVTVTGTLNIQQQSEGRQKTAKFEPYLDGYHIAVQETDRSDIDISADERERIMALADGADGDPLEIAADSLAPKIHGYDHIKQALILAMVGGARTEYATGDFDRGEFHVLLLGDPGTAKSRLIERVEELGWRTVGVSGKGATVAGTTATATQDDFGDGEWTLKAGAFVKANRGAVCVDELDDMPAEVRAAMLEPMSKQSIHITKGGINTKLNTRTAVVAAGNPVHGRFDQYEAVQDQFDLGSTLLSRFDLIYTLQDKPDPERDAEISEHILRARDAAKRRMNGEEIDADDRDIVDPAVEPDILRKWIALASQRDPPTFASTEVREQLQDRFNSLRAAHGYNEDSPVPVTFRKLEGTVRVAEAIAKLEFSDVITQRHARIAAARVGDSMQDFGTDEEGNLDADVQETGSSKNQREQMEAIGSIIDEFVDESDDRMAEKEAVIGAACSDLEMDEGRVEQLIRKMRHKKGVVTQPQQGFIRFLGWS